MLSIAVKVWDAVVSLRTAIVSIPFFDAVSKDALADTRVSVADVPLAVVSLKRFFPYTIVERTAPSNTIKIDLCIGVDLQS